MSTMTRTDIHRPSSPEFDPTAYSLAGVFDLDDEWGIRDRVEAVQACLAAGYRFAAHQVIAHCGHCGVGIRYAALLLHERSREMIWVGETCLDERFLSLTAERFQELRKAGKLNREWAAKAERIAETCRWSPRLADLTYPEVAWEMGEFIGDVAAKFRRYGELSDRQIEAVDKAFDRWIERANELQAEDELLAVDAPAGRVVVTGTILHTRAETNPYSYRGEVVVKMLVRDDRGFKVWGTKPVALCGIGADRGTRVRFTATLAPSEDDPTFAIASRPSKAVVLDDPADDEQQ